MKHLYNKVIKTEVAKSKKINWRESLMKVLHCMYDTELTWNSDLWETYGISSSDAQKIKNEFNKYIKTK